MRRRRRARGRVCAAPRKIGAANMRGEGLLYGVGLTSIEIKGGLGEGAAQTGARQMDGSTAACVVLGGAARHGGHGGMQPVTTERSVGVHGQSVGGVRRPECRLAGPSTPRYLALPTLPLPARLLISCSLFATRRALLFSSLFARKAAEPTRRTSLRRKHPCCRAPTSCDSCVVYFAREGRPTEVSYPARLL